ncbi:MAG: T9SS type A sorting domain-containing protein [Saprospiraceae bacterium]|nr:T9SS type A sorting domain-containing protein [Saprospiraceae bacterium]
MSKIFIILLTVIICCGGISAYSHNILGSANKDVKVLKLMMPQPGDEVEIKISPNPANDYFTVTSNVTYNRIILYNLIGKPVKTYSPEIDSNYYLSDLPGGIYILRFLDNHNQVIKTIKLYKRS